MFFNWKPLRRFCDPIFPCNKRTPGIGCAAISGYNQMHAIFGASEHCIAIHPSNLAVAYKSYANAFLYNVNAFLCIKNATLLGQTVLSS